MIIPPPIDDVSAPIMLMIPPLRPLRLEQWQHKSERETTRPPKRATGLSTTGNAGAQAPQSRGCGGSSNSVCRGQSESKRSEAEVVTSQRVEGPRYSSRSPKRGIAGSPGRDATRVAPSPRTRACTGAAGTSPSDAPTGVYRLRSITTRIPAVVMDELAKDLDAQAKEGV